MSFNATPRRQKPAPAQHGVAAASTSTPASKFRSSLFPMSRASPARSPNMAAKSVGPSASSRDIFRTSTPQSSRVSRFAPSLSTSAAQASSGIRKFAAPQSTSGGMSSTASTELFKMKIPEPDPALTGELLAKEVPNDPARKGSVYADQYLAHKVPSHFDDLQRRQFFAILDLRRLKFAADEIFTKKDWKMNILNFAKEYEKSRGLILLRYGLYEFQKVKPSADVMKQWRAKHGLPEPEPEAIGSNSQAKSGGNRPAPFQSTSTKRKAEDDLQTKDTALTASTANQNKRRNVAQEPTDEAPAFGVSPKKNKRKADDTDEPDENQPSKVQKGTPSAAHSKLESIINSTQRGNGASTGSPLKRPALTATPSQPAIFGGLKSTVPGSKPSLFGSATNGDDSLASKSKPSIFQPSNALNGTGPGGSVLSAHKLGSRPEPKKDNIFGYLSESSANNSGNENGNEDADGEEEESGNESVEETEEETQETGSVDAAPSYEPSAAASTGTRTPPVPSGSTLFPFSKPAPTSNVFGSSSQSMGGDLFSRISRGPDGQPLRAGLAETEEEDQEAQAAGGEGTSETVPSKTPAKQPGDFTFNAATTPISFNSAGSTNFAPKPAASLFGSATAPSPPKAEDQSARPAAPASASSIFAANAAKPTSSTPSLFGGFNKSSEPAKPSSGEAPSQLFAPKQPSSTPSTLFGSQPATGGKDNEIAIPKEQPKPLFGSQPAFGGSAAVNPASVFGNLNKADQKATEGPSAAKKLFGTDSATSSPSVFGNAPASSTSLFGAKPPAPAAPASSLFAPKPAATPSATQEPSSKRQRDNGSDEAEKPQEKRTLFGSTAPKEQVPASATLFGSTPSKAAPLFGSSEPKDNAAANAPAQSTPVFQFGSSSAAPSEAKPVAAAPMQSNMFGNSTSSAPVFSFGAAANAPAAAPAPASAPPVFSFGANNAASTSAQTNGAASKPMEFNFGGGSSSGGSTPFVFGGNQTPSSSAGQSFSFGAGGNGQTGMNNPFANANAQSSNTSTPSSSFQFQFGQQQPSTPAPAQQTPSLFGSNTNGASATPSVQLTQATPPQPASSIFGSKAPATSGPMFGHLQPSGNTSAGPGSPFPAPSSINTTPVNGTPEPQTAPEDGEEHHEQISLTEGGPGEEDETLVHEIRAKAIKYVPVVKGEEDEEEKSKSPWRTQGVGPLRVLKNKTTGHVRVLLRAEPRGHVAMNKALLPDIKYEAKDKTLNFTASKDDGSGLETWVLQVKKPEAAKELAQILESNKVANKA